MAYGQPNYYQPQYGNPYYYQPQQYTAPQIQQPIVQQNTQQQQSQTLFGKVVDCFETAKGQDVPIGMSGIYPQADGKSIFIKRWLENGTTATDIYQLVEQTSVKDDKLPTIDWSERFDNLSDEIDALSRKIDKIKVPTQASTTTTMKKRRQEVDEDDA